MSQQSTLADRLQQSPYQAYSYSYPHKTAYRPFVEAKPMAELWGKENRDALFLYIHIPFCEMRCGFCNLFTVARPPEVMMQEYVESLERQMRQMDAALGERKFARFALGGGTPTLLSPEQLNKVLSDTQTIMGVSLQDIPCSVESSPETATTEHMEVLARYGIDRVSIGVQSFVPSECQHLQRRQNNDEVFAAMDRIKAKIPVLNVDLIYGIEGQTQASWQETLDIALEHRPQELYLYPLYVRALTGLDKAGRKAGDEYDQRLAFYRQGRDFLLANGYEQLSMRMFRDTKSPAVEGPVYCCQEDGMVGLGAGARSYSMHTHYSGEYAVSRTSVKGIIEDYIETPDENFSFAHYGVELDLDNRRRRFIIQSLLNTDGLNLSQYFERFQSTVFDDYPQLNELFSNELAVQDGEMVYLNETGMMYADTIGPWLVSDQVSERMSEYALS